MRYDRLVYFVKKSKSIYNPDTGNYEQKEPVKTPVYASVMEDTSNDLSRAKVLEYGKVDQEVLLVQLQNHYLDPFDYIEIGGKKYEALKSRRLRTKHTFVTVGVA